MSSITAHRPSSPLRIVSETALLTGRSLRAIPRVPERLLDVTIQPVIFILLFLYVFGSAIHVGIPYKDYLAPGILGQTAAFGMIGAGTATATDMGEGVIDRFRSMPVNRLAIITGEVVGQFCEQLLGIVITVGVLLALGWSPDLTLVHGIELAALLLFAMFAFTWAGLLLGLVIRSPDAVQGAAFIVVLPLTFLAGTFVKISGMDLIPRVIGEWDPISPLVATARDLTTHLHSSGSLPLDHPELAMVGWSLILLLVCVPLALRRFNRVTAA